MIKTGFQLNLGAPNQRKSEDFCKETEPVLGDKNIQGQIRCRHFLNFVRPRKLKHLAKIAQQTMRGEFHAGWTGTFHKIRQTRLRQNT